MLASTPWFVEIVEFSSNKFPWHGTLSVWSISPAVRSGLYPSSDLYLDHSSSRFNLLLPLVDARQDFHYSPRSYTIPNLQRVVCVHDACNRLVWIVAESYKRDSLSLSNIDRSILLARSVEKISINLSSTVAFSINLWFVFHRNTWEIKTKIISLTYGKIYDFWKRELRIHRFLIDVNMIGTYCLEFFTNIKYAVLKIDFQTKL